MEPQAAPRADEHLNLVTSIPFFLIHLRSLAAIFTGVQARDLILCGVLYAARMFFITAGYHRYFAHRSYRMNRVMQFLMALGGTTAAQKGPLWWAGNHRDHHRFADTEGDVHSPLQGFWWSHVGWILCDRLRRGRLRGEARRLRPLPRAATARQVQPRRPVAAGHRLLPLGWLVGP